jgi:hypothetical protein
MEVEEAEIKLGDISQPLLYLQPSPSTDNLFHTAASNDDHPKHSPPGGTPPSNNSNHLTYIDFLDGNNNNQSEDVRYSNLMGGAMLQNTFNKATITTSVRKESSTNSAGGVQGVEARNEEEEEE